MTRPPPRDPVEASPIGPGAPASAEPSWAVTSSGAAGRYGAVLLGGALGALLRWAQCALLAGGAPGAWPWGTFVVNVAGSLALATFLAALLASASAHPLWRPFFAVGVCGAFTTFSSFSNETSGLSSAGRVGLALGYVAASVIVGLACAHGGDLLVQARRRTRWAVAAAVGAPLLVPALTLLVVATRGGLPEVALATDAPAIGAVAVGGGTGAAARYAVGGWVSARAGGFFPWGTFVVNLTGCVLIGLFEGCAEVRGGAPPLVRLLLGVGWLCGYTTFSTLSFETLALVRERGWRGAAANAVGSVVAGVLAVQVGRWIGGLA